MLKTHYKHAELLGLPRKYNTANAVAFEETLHRFVESSQTVRIRGTWLRQPAIFYAEYDTSVVLICRPDETYWSLIKLTEYQRWHFWYEGSLGGH